jgi:hypothetical protein
MTTNLSEAARLYLADIDVLEEARGELDNYIEAVWKEFSAAVPFPGKPTFDHDGRVWAGWADGCSPRYLYFATTTSGSVFKLGVCDPFWSDEPRTFAVWLWCNKGDKTRIERNGDLRKVIDEGAARGLRVDFGDVTDLCSKYLPVDDGAGVGAMGKALGGLLRDFAAHAGALNAVLAALGMTVAENGGSSE